MTRRFINQVEPYITENEKKAIADYLDSGAWLTEFIKTREFEGMLGEFIGGPFVTVLPSGTVALYLSLLASGIGPGDKVIVPNYTMIATPNAVVWAGAEPVLVDVEPETLCLDINRVPINESTKGVLYVSINGRSGNMQEVVGFCRQHGLVLIEDACQSLGSSWNTKYLGTFGDLGSFSFSPHKIITTGQGGCIVTQGDAFHLKVQKLKDFNRTAPATDWHDGIGYNFKFTDLQAVIGIEQLRIIEFRISRKKEIFRKYCTMLSEVKEVKFLPTNLDETTPWFVDPLLPSKEIRDKLAAYLKDKGIGSRPYYPPVNHQPIYAPNHPKGSLPVAEGIVGRGLWLPSSIGLTDDEITYVCSTIKTFFEIHR